jgi:CheY-like chemotaxis protein
MHPDGGVGFAARRGQAKERKYAPPRRRVCNFEQTEGRLLVIVNVRSNTDERSGLKQRVSAYPSSRQRLSGRRKMTPENPGRQKRDGTHPLVGLPDLRSPGARHSVILVADDDALIRNLVTLLMQQDGHFVLSAADGHEGLELSRQYPGSIDLVITDVQMPRLNGTDLCAHLFAERPGIKVLVMSGADMSEIVSQNVNLPFLPKPFDGQTLKARVRAILAAPAQPPIDLLSLDIRP